MNLNISNDSLRQLLEEKRDFIGGDLIAYISLFITVFTSAINYYENIWALLFFSVLTLWSGLLCWKHAKHRYNHQKLYVDIQKLDLELHRFSLIAIRDSFNKYPNKFLLRYDEKWDCYLLPYFRTLETTDNIIQGLEGMLKVSIDASSLTFKSRDTYLKYSPADERNKQYCHSFFYLSHLQFQKIHKQKEFTIEDNKFKWFTLDEMRNDKNIMSKNEDVVDILSKTVF